MAIGDSITDFDDNPEYTQHRITKGYMSLVKEKLPYVDYANHGHSGWTTRQMVQNWDKLGVEKADVYTIFLGTNDWHQGHVPGTVSDYKNRTGVNTIAGAFRELTDRIRQLNPKATIMVMAPMQRTDFVDINNYQNLMHGGYQKHHGVFVSEIVDLLGAIAKSDGLVFVDLYNKSGMTMENAVKFKRVKDPQTGKYRDYKYPDYIGIPFDPKADSCPYPLEAVDFTYDGLHPSDKGYAVIADMLVKEFKKIKVK